MKKVQNVLAGVIGGGFGLDFVIPNAGAPLDPALVAIVRVAALVAFIALLAVIALSWKRSRRLPASPARQRNLFGRRYWWIVLVEFGLIIAGRNAILALHIPVQATVAWTALVVGAHFLAFVRFGVWDARVRVLGRTLVALGALGLVLVPTPAVSWVPDVTGVLSGFALLIGSLRWTIKDLARTSTGPCGLSRSPST